jgi:Na+/melibiose symporter-like transporter
MKPLRCLLVAVLSTMLGFTLVGHLGFYLLGFYVCGGDLKEAAFIAGIKSSVALVLAVAACPAVGFAAKRYGKSRVLACLIAFGLVSSISQWFLITPKAPYLSLVSDVGCAVCLAGFWTLMPAFLGDVCDQYQRITGNSCQGSLSALYGIAVKVGASLALLATGYILVFCGFHADMPHAEMAEPLRRMRILFAVVPAIGIGISLVAMARFRIEPLPGKPAPDS